MEKLTKPIVDISVVIPTKNRENDLLECLNSIFKQDLYPKEVIIVDQSDNEIKKEIQTVIPNEVTLVYIYDRNISGATQARNIALKQVRSGLVLLLDDDLILLDNSLKSTLDVFKNDVNSIIGGIGGYAINERSSLFHLIAVRIFCHGPFSFWSDQLTFDWKAKSNNALMLKSRIVPAGASCIRSIVFKKFKFDENLVGYTHGDDAIFGYSVSSQFLLFLYSGLRFYHKKRVDATKDREQNIKRQIIWWFYFFDKYVKKTLFNELCYFWSLIGIGFKILIRAYDLALLRGAFNSIRYIIVSIITKVPIDLYMRNSQVLTMFEKKKVM